MKRRILSILMALALCVGFLPAPARAAGTTLTKPLDFTKVGDGDRQTPARGPGYELTGNSSDGYTLTLDGLSLNATEYDDTQYWGMRGRTAIALPEDGPVTVALNGKNTISASCIWNDAHAICAATPYNITIKGTRVLEADVEGCVISISNESNGSKSGNLIIQDATIKGRASQGGLYCSNGSITIERANITIATQGLATGAIHAPSPNQVFITNSNVSVSCGEYPGIFGQKITIIGGTVEASGGGGYGAFLTGTLSVNGLAVIEPAGGTVGQQSILDKSGAVAVSAKLSAVTLNDPTGTFACTYGDTNTAKVTLTTTPAITSTVEIYGGDTQLGAGNLGEEITINTSGLSAGEHTLTAKLPNELGEKEFTVKVNPKPLTVTGATATDRAYDGTKEVEVTTVTLDGVLENDRDKVSVNTTNLKGTISGTGVGNYDSVTLPEMSLTGAAAGNYTLTQPTGAVTASVAILQASYEGLSVVNTSAKFGTTGTYDLTSLIQGIDGAVLESSSIVGGDIFEETPTVSGNILTYKLKADAAVGSTGTITVPVTSTNYQDFNLTVTVTVTDKNVPTLTVSPITVEYTGEPVLANAIKGTATVDGQTVPGTWSFAAGQALTAVADSGAKTVKFTPTDGDTYAEVEGMVTLTINKATPTGTPTYTAISASGKTLADAGLTAPDGWPTGTLDWNLPADTAVTANTRYEWTFTPEDTSNYERLEGVITLWVQNTGGGSSSGNSGSSGAAPAAAVPRLPCL